MNRLFAKQIKSLISNFYISCKKVTVTIARKIRFSIGVKISLKYFKIVGFFLFMATLLLNLAFSFFLLKDDFVPLCVRIVVVAT